MDSQLSKGPVNNSLFQDIPEERSPFPAECLSANREKFALLALSVHSSFSLRARSMFRRVELKDKQDWLQAENGERLFGAIHYAEFGDIALSTAKVVYADGRSTVTTPVYL